MSIHARNDALATFPRTACRAARGLVAFALACWIQAIPATAHAQSPLSDIVQVTTGIHHTCALTSDGVVKCWGGNTNGQLGDGTTTDRPLPVQVVGLGSGIVAISARDEHTCAVTGEGALTCWGYNFYGQLGDGTTTNRLTPVDVPGMGSGVTAVSAGYGRTCALTGAGAAKCWGWNGYGQLGDGTTTWRLTPVDVVGLGGGVADLSLGDSHTCARTQLGGARCWGYNASGQLGDGTTTNRLAPVDVVGLGGGVATIGAGLFHTCASSTGGGATCWGRNNNGQLGDGTGLDRPIPVPVVGLDSGVATIGADGPSCALTHAGGAMCWGGNWFGQLGDGSTDNRHLPVEVVGLGSGVAAISPSFDHSCALTSGGGVKCWGRNGSGQLGDGTTEDRLTAVDVLGPMTPIELSVFVEPLGDLRSATPELRGYRISVANLGGEIAQDVLLSVPAPTGLTDVLWQCQAPAGCTPAAGAAAVATGFDLPGGATASVELSGEVLPDAAFVDIHAHAGTASGGGAESSVSTSDPANGIGLMKNGFER